MATSPDPLHPDFAIESAADLLRVIATIRAELDFGHYTNLDQFLEAMEAWIETFPNYYTNTNRPIPDPSWKFVADCLRAARVYE